MADLTRKTANLFDPNSTRYHMGKGSNNRIGSVANGAMFYIEAAPNTNYTIKIHTTDSTFVRLYLSNAPIVENVAESYNVISESETTINPEVTISNTNYTYLWIQAGGTWYTEHGGESIMLNTGSTALPYEPYGWVHSLRKLCSATETIQSGDTIYANGQPITTYTLKGNTVQNGTPTPSNPVAVNGVGERTENLYNYQAVAIGKYIDANGVEQTSGSTGHQILNHTASIPVIAGTTYTFKIQKIIGYSALSNAYCWFDSSNQLLYRDVRGEIGSREEYIEMSYTAPTNAAYLIINFRDNYYNTGMLNVGSTALPYEPYGYKIPILNLPSTTNIYLSEPLMKINDSVDSISNTEEIRAIQKLVITGDETSWEQDGRSGNNNRYRLRLTNLKNTGTYITDFYNSHYKVESGYAANTSVIWRGSSSTYVYISVPSSDYPTVSDYKTYLQQQYTNGTPVTIWYQMANPTTTQITAPSIPTTDGANTITVDTTVQPSEVSMTWTGWHNASVKEKSENLIPTDISDWEQGGISSTDGTDTVSTTRLRTIDFYPINNNTDYYISVNDTDYCYVNIILYDSSKQYAGQYYLVDSAINGATALAINVPSSAIANVAYYRAVAKKRDDSTITAQEIADIKPMLNLGSTSQTYAPYWE